MMRLFYFFFLIVNFISAQQKYCASLKSALHNKILSDKNFDVLIKGDIVSILKQQNKFKIRIKYYANDIACANVNVNAIKKLIETNLISYIEYIPKTLNANPGLCDSTLIKNRIKDVKDGKLPLTRTYTGKDVIVGIIDTGIDINHPDFKDSNGTTRVQFLWDQAAVDNKRKPNTFDYGIEWTKQDINNGICKHKDKGHGTYVSGLAAGNGKVQIKNAGCASNSNLIVVALDFNRPGPTTADAVKYIIDKATALNKPFIINVSYGNYFGSHDGTNLETKLIDGLIADIPGRAIIAAVGNKGDVKFHTKTRVVLPDTNFTWLYNYNSTIDYWLYADTSAIKNIKYSVGVNRTTFFDLGRIGFKTYKDAMDKVRTDTLKFNSNRIGLIQTSSSINPYGVYELNVKILKDSLNYFWRIESTGEGLFDSWNFDFVSNGLPLESIYPKMKNYVMPDSLSTLVSGLQCSKEVITVGNYSDSKCDLKLNTFDKIGEIVKNSSVGPTRNGIIKPDICATGNGVVSCKASNLEVNGSNSNVNAANTDHYYEIGGGTSASSAIVAGWAALYLEAYPFSTNRMIIESIQKSGRFDEFTTKKLPNNKWGYGKFDGFKAAIYPIFKQKK